MTPSTSPLWFAAWLISAVSLLAPSFGNDDAEESLPNLVLIMADDLGKEWVSCYGADGIETPHIDALAQTGMKFENFYCMPQCTPTRVSLLTGQYPFRHGWVNHWDVPRWGGGCSFDPELNPSFPRAIRSAGYATAAAGKWQIDDFRVEPDAMQAAGFNAYCMWTGYEKGNAPSARRYQDPYVYEDGKATTRQGAFGPDVYADYLVDFIGKSKARPMMIYFPMALPHGPLVPTPDEPAAATKLERHRAMVRHVDKLVGRLVAALEENGLRRRTVIVFTTDNGTSRDIVGSRDGVAVKGGKATTAESGVNVPLIVSCPGRIAEKSTSSALVDITDIAPTLCELAGVESRGESFDGHFDGHSMVDVLDGRTQTTARPWILAMGGGNRARLTEAGVENEYWFRDRVLRNERFKAFIGSDGRLVKLIDLLSPTPDADVQDAESPAVLRAKGLFLEAVREMPGADSDPSYSHVEARDWYVKPTAKSRAWKKGNPAH
ncbi:MAG: sulfatase-like hydrolase/transferase [Planctomycetota bacterium]